MAETDATTWFYDVIWPLNATVLRLALILTGNQAEAEDLAQETLLKAYRGREQFKPGTDAKAWLMTILRNTRIDRLRAASREAANVSLDAMKVEPVGSAATENEVAWDRPEEILEAFSDSQVIEALQRLPEEIRWTLLLVDVEQLQMQDAARLLGVPVGTIKSRAHRGRAMLREALSPVARDLRRVP